MKHFRNRIEAGQLLAVQLQEYVGHPDVLVLALPRGGVPVAYEIAKVLQAPLDLCLVRKLGVPTQPELAMGAIASGGVMVLNEGVLQSLHISQDALTEVAAQEQQELKRRDRAYRGEQPFPDLRDRSLIVVDDGIATGSTMRAAVTALRTHQPKQIIIAVPVAPPQIDQMFQAVADRVVCLIQPDSLSSIGMWYDDFSQTDDDEVRELLQRSRQEMVDKKSSCEISG
ncbi:MAG TPA: phosphoribosyltransferase [Trichocoleus sp.]|jgi:putative phosphoribosyl transferase